MSGESRERQIQRFYEVESDDYDERRWTHEGGRETDAAQAAIAEELIQQAPRGLFLELGVGTGRFSVALATPERPAVALDISAGMLGRTLERARRAGKRECLRPVQASGLALPFANASVGACISFNVFSHLPDAEATLTELSRVVRPGGLLAINFPNAQSPYLPYALGVKLTGDKSLLRGVHTRWYTPREVRGLLENAGFDVVDTRGQLHYPWAKNAALRGVLRRMDSAVRKGALSSVGSIYYVVARRG